MAGKYYAVRCGRKPGIYYSWDICKKVVDGYPGAKYKSFKTKEEALAFVGDAMITENNSGKETKQAFSKEPEHYAFVDGSFNTQQLLYTDMVVSLLQMGSAMWYRDLGLTRRWLPCAMLQEKFLGSMAAMKLALELGLTELTIYYDYMGIEMWATGQWKRNKQGTIAYYDYVQSIRSRLKLTFVKVKGHSGVEGNEEADRIAKHAVGIE